MNARKKPTQKAPSHAAQAASAPPPARSPRGASPATFRAVAVGAILLIAVGLGFRALADYLNRSNHAPPLPPGALASIPLEMGDWTGRDELLDERVRIATDTDDLVNREYRNTTTGDVVGFYVAYGGQARDLEPHRPEVCYPGNGWTPGRIEYTELTVELPSKVSDSAASRAASVSSETGGPASRHPGVPADRQSGEPAEASNRKPAQDAGDEQSRDIETFKLPCRILTFSRGGFDLRTIVVVNYYIVDGKYWADVELLRELSAWGSHNVQYMAQVQVTSTTSGFRDLKAATAAATKFAAASAEAVRKAVSPPATSVARPQAAASGGPGAGPQAESNRSPRANTDLNAGANGSDARKPGATP